jgi:ankyrin repeat protein
MERLGKEPETIEAVKMLLDLGLDVNSFNDLGQTVLHAVTQRGRPGTEDGPNTVESEQLIRFLVAQGARVDAEDKAGRTPARMAVQTKNALAQRVFAELADVRVAPAGNSAAR